MGPWGEVAVAGLVLVLAACGPGEATTAAVPAGAVVQPGESFPAGLPTPAEATVLSIHGATGAPNDGDVISLDLATLERLGLHEWTVYEPFLDADATFRGVPFDALLEAVGVPDHATEVEVTALDDYQVTIALEDLRRGDVLLATQDPTPGPIGVDRGGPTRFIWRDGSPLAANPDLWIWSLRTVVVR